MKVRARYIHSKEESLALIYCARDLYQKSRAENAKIVRDSRRKAALAFLRKRDSGFRLGFEAGRKEALDALGQYQIDAQSNYRKTLDKAKRECLDLAIQIAEQIVQSEIQCNRSSLRQKISRIISQIVDSRALMVIVSHEDRMHLEDNLATDFPTRGLRVLESNAIETGNAIIRSVAGEIEINWKHHLKLLKEALLVAVR